MELDYAELGELIARRRKDLGLRQVQVCEMAGINDKYLSCNGCQIKKCKDFVRN